MTATIHAHVIPVDADKAQDGDDGMLDMIARLLAGTPHCQCGRCGKQACENEHPASGTNGQDTATGMDDTELDLNLDGSLTDLRHTLSDAVTYALDAAHDALALDRLDTAEACNHTAGTLLARIHTVDRLLNGTDDEEDDQ